MAEIAPFCAVRYAARSGGELSELLAPAYDLVSPEERAALLARSPFNVAHLTMGEVLPGDGPHASKYTRAAERWASWLARGVLRRDAAPALYPLEQTFLAPDGRPVRRRGFMAAVRLHDLEERVIVPHEKTLVAPRVDRLELLKAVRANLSPLLGLYRDDGGATAQVLDGALMAEPAAEADSDDGVHHRLWKLEAPAAVAALVEVVREHRIFLADGHHRYVTALLYRRLLDAETPGLPPGGGHHHMLMYLCPRSDPGLMLFPTHRLLSGLPGLSLPRLLEGLGRYFVVETLPEDIRRPAGRAWAVARLAEHAGKASAFVMVSAEDQRARVLTLRDDADLDEAGLPRSETQRMLDVTVLHGVVLQRLLGLSPDAQERQESLTFVRDAGEAVSRVLSGEHQLGFLLNPTPMWQVQAVGEAGETMPQKTTLFYPRLQSGLVMREVRPTGGP